MVRIAIDISNFTVAQMHANAASACAHVARRGFDIELLVLGASAVFHDVLLLLKR
jgi:hypothetical protein